MTFSVDWGSYLKGNLSDSFKGVLGVGPFGGYPYNKSPTMNRHEGHTNMAVLASIYGGFFHFESILGPR